MKDLTIKEAAKLLGISSPELRRKIYNEEIETIKKESEDGLQYYIPESEIKKLSKL